MSMKNKFRSRRKYRFGFTGRVFLTLVLALGLLGGALLPSKAAEEDSNGNQQCTLTVNVPDSVTVEEVEKAKIRINLYQIAGVGTGSTVFTLCDPFTALTITNNMTAAESHQLAQTAAEIVKNGGATEVKKTGVEIGEAVNRLDPGLYLLIARGEDTEDYFDVNASNEIVTKAVTDEFTFIFSPVLVALPGANGDTSVNVNLKMEHKSDEEYGSLKIVKTLNGFAMGGDPATFVFQVEAVLEGRKVYSNVVTLVFDKAGTKELLVKNIPVGAEVKVTEVYSGASYSLTTNATQTVTIPADQVVAVSFTNRYDERENGGQSITNHFEYDETNGWTLHPQQNKSQG